MIIKLDHITKIEGHAQLLVKIEHNKIKQVRLKVFEAARFFEALVLNRKYDEIGSITSRICGICSQAHLICAHKAVEHAFGLEVSEQTKLLRELLLMGATIQSHVLHCYFLALPDYLGYSSVISMAHKYRDEIKRALRLKQLANEIVTVLGGREIHSITPVVGGFSKLPTQKEILALVKKLKKLKKDAIHMAKLFGSLKLPKFERRTTYVGINSSTAKIKSSDGMSIDTSEYDKYIIERVRKGQTAKYAVIGNNPYMVGALARLNLNMYNLSKEIKNIINSSEIKFPNYNPFVNNFAQAIEVVHFFDKIIYELENLKLKQEKIPKLRVKATRGIGILEAPRGLLIHDYVFNKRGFVVKANIITPTAQNLGNMEADIKTYLHKILHFSKQKLILNLEKLIRAYDPCISCSAHFLKVKFKRTK